MPRSASSRRFYAVAVGRTPGVYRTWADCQTQIAGYRCSVFRAFDREADAARFVETNRVGAVATTATPPSAQDLTALSVYTDGSHVKGTTRRGYGAWCRYDGREYELAVQADGDPPAVSNPTLELRAAAHVLEALVVARPPAVRRITVVADYAGVAHYINGSWDASRCTVPHFAREAWRIKRAVHALTAQGLAVTGRHVAGHSGDEGNEAADRLAKARSPIDTFTALVGCCGGAGPDS
jgi:ribonuclease HI